MEKSILQLFELLREKGPLVHNISNLVVMNNTANALLALGASPIMAHAKEELAEIIKISNALVINIGTLNKEWSKSMIKAAEIANKKNKPWVLDPVGAGISKLRNETIKELLHLNPTVIRGNASEIMACHRFQSSGGKGVDSIASSDDALESAKGLQEHYGSIVCISGEVDFILSTTCLVSIKNGSPMMTKVTGLGCTASSIIGAFLGIGENPFESAVAGVAITSLAGELAAQQAPGPGTLQWKLYDVLYQLTSEQISKNLKIEKHVFKS